MKLPGSFFPRPLSCWSSSRLKNEKAVCSLDCICWKSLHLLFFTKWHFLDHFLQGNSPYFYFSSRVIHDKVVCTHICSCWKSSPLALFARKVYSYFFFTKSHWLDYFLQHPSPYFYSSSRLIHDKIVYNLICSYWKSWLLSAFAGKICSYCFSRNAIALIIFFKDILLIFTARRD